MCRGERDVICLPGPAYGGKPADMREKGKQMKTKLMIVLAACGLALTLATVAATSDKDKTIVGDGACAKCVLGETKKCQITIAADEDGKKVTYYLTSNEVAKQFGNQFCTHQKKVVATGTVKTVAGKQELTATKIELAKD